MKEGDFGGIRIEPELFTDDSQVMKLDLAGSRITTLPLTLSSYSSLTELKYAPLFFVSFLPFPALPFGSVTQISSSHIHSFSSFQPTI